MKADGTVRHAACQTIYSTSGEVLFYGEWDPRRILETLGPRAYWRGRTVLDIGANTSGLSIEIARLGAKVTAAEPDPRRTNRALALPIIESTIEAERIDLTLVENDAFDLSTLGQFDTVLFLGLLYHFRHPQYALDLVSQVVREHLYVGSQTIPGEGLLMANRLDAALGLIDLHRRELVLSGWQPTHDLLVKMIELSGFGEILPLTDKSLNFPDKPRGHTNNAYYRATKKRHINLEETIREFT